MLSGLALTHLTRGSSLKNRTRIATVIAAGGTVVAIAVVIVVIALKPHSNVRALKEVPVPVVTPDATPSTAEIAELPEAKYDAVIGGLIAIAETDQLPATVDTYTLKHDAALYGADERTPVARLAAENFLAERTTVLAVKQIREWTLVLTPARQALPSKNGGTAAAQTAAWIRTGDLTGKRTIDSALTVSVSKQSLTVRTGGTTNTFAAGVGVDATPTPTEVTGYLQARYLDPAQGQSLYPIQLTSLHATTADEPLPGGTGGLIGVHYQTETDGKVSHGCIRLSTEAITTVNTLPLGTPITITN